MNAATSRQIEQFGVILQAEGYSRVAGRLFGLLLLSEHPRALGALAGELAVTKASVSTNARLLEHLGIVERVGRAGDRQDYYIISPDILERTVEQRLGRWQRLLDVIVSTRTAVGGQCAVVKARLLELEAAHRFTLDSMAASLAHWQRMTRRARVATLKNATQSRSRTPRSTPDVATKSARRGVRVTAT